MLPGGALSTVAHFSGFMPPRNSERAKLIDSDAGGIALQDTSMGLRYQSWKAAVVGNDVVLSADTVAPSAVYTQAGITELSMTFDQNMNVFLAYTLNDTDPRFRWYDATVPGFVVTSLPAGSYNLRCALDDKRPSQGSVNDIILTYLRAGSLYYRQQRDRYNTEYLLRTGLTDYRLGQFGMNLRHRMQWQLFRTG